MTSNNIEQFEQLFRTHFPRMLRMAYSMLRDEEESRDAVHDVFTRLWEQGIELQPSRAEGYLVMAVRNNCLNRMAHHRLDDKLRRLYPLEQTPQLAPPDDDEERLAQIRSYIDHELSPQTRRVMQLCYDEDHTYRETAEQLGISVAAVNKHIVKALRLLRSHFSKDK